MNFLIVAMELSEPMVRSHDDLFGLLQGKWIDGWTLFVAVVRKFVVEYERATLISRLHLLELFVSAP